MNDPLDLATYTDEYKQRLQPHQTLENSSERWHRLLEAKPLLYLPDRSPNDDFDARDARRRLWTRKELEAFGNTVEERTQRVLSIQEAALKHWHECAIHIQRLARGLLARQFVARERNNLLQLAVLYAWERAQALGRIARQQAARTIQRLYRDHCERTRKRERARRSLQRTARLFLFRCRRRAACRVIQRAFRWWHWRRRLLAQAKALAQMRALATKHQKLAVAAAAFREAQRAMREQRQLQLWREHGAKLQTLTRVRRRQQQVSALASASFPSLGLKHTAVRTRNGTEGGRAEGGWNTTRTRAPIQEKEALALPPLLGKGREKSRWSAA